MEFFKSTYTYKAASNGRRIHIEGIVVVVSGALLFLCALYFLRSSDFDKPSNFMIEVFQKQAPQRKQFLSNVKSVNNVQGYGIIYNVLAPEVYCPDLVKVGTTEDGGKWMCAPQNLPDDCVIYALGISGKITYEQDIQKYSNQRCRVISVDQGRQSETVINALAEIRGTVEQSFIAEMTSGENKTMGDILEANGVSDIEILKMDIEGAELVGNTMKDFLDKYTPSQIMIEIHGTPSQVVDLLKLFSSKGYLLFHFEINGRQAILCEYAFIHESQLERYGSTYLAKFLDL